MIRLDATTRKLQAVLAGAITTNQLPITVCYSDKTTTTYNGATQLTNTNSTSQVDICAAPAASTVRDIDFIGIRNRDTAAATVTVLYDDNGTDYQIISSTLDVGDVLTYVHGNGWQVVTLTGELKTSGSGGGTGDVVGPASATDNAVARFDSTTGKLIKNSAFIVDNSGYVTSFGGQITFPASQAASANVNTLDDYEEGQTTPTATAGSGAITTSACVLDYTKIGRLVTLAITLSITTNGTAAASIIIPLPFAAATGVQSVIVGRENALTGSQLQGIILSAGTIVTVYTYNNTYPGGSGASIILGGCYMAAT